MAIEDILGNLMEAGGSNGRWKGPWAILGLLVGAGMGGYLAYSMGEGTFAGTIGGTFTGAFLGWVVALILRGLGVILLITLLILPFVLGWNWLTGAG